MHQPLCDPGIEDEERARAAKGEGREAGALASSISGSGPSMFAFCRSVRSASDVGMAMVAAFQRAGLEASAVISAGDCPGVRRV